MKMLIRMLLIVAVAMPVLASVPALAQDEVNWAALPTDKEKLQELDTKQLRMLRASVRYCEDFGHQHHEKNACVFLDLDRSVRQSDDEALKAYHFGMSRTNRYSENRNVGGVINRLLRMREKALSSN